MLVVTLLNQLVVTTNVTHLTSSYYHHHHHHAETTYVIFGGNDHPETEMTIQKRNVWTSEEVSQQTVYPSRPLV